MRTFIAYPFSAFAGLGIEVDSMPQSEADVIQVRWPPMEGRSSAGVPRVRGADAMRGGDGVR